MLSSPQFKLLLCMCTVSQHQLLLQLYSECCDVTPSAHSIGPLWTNASESSWTTLLTCLLECLSWFACDEACNWPLGVGGGILVIQSPSLALQTFLFKMPQVGCLLSIMSLVSPKSV